VKGVGASVRHRRLTSVTVAFVAFAGAVTFAPLLFAAAVFADIATLQRHWRYVRLTAMVLFALAIEVVGIVALGALWIVTAGGRVSGLDRVYFALQHWWIGVLLTAAHKTLGLRILVEDPEPARRGSVIVIGRHASVGDAAIPAALLGHRHRLDVRYVLKDDLQWDPCIDIVGHRLGHHFVDRSDDSGQAAEPIRRLAARVDERGAAVIFPEGTFFSPERKARSIERLASGSRPELAERAARLQHLLPPRPTGTLALLDGAPGADVVVLGHIGFEQFTSLRAIVRAVPFREPVRVWVRRIPRSEVPLGDRARVDWLYAQWQRLDDDISARLASA
jgi:1-acyl-sn-glycerol-3-phosphate acyltransferase